MEKKITLKEFWESDGTLAIHCSTEEEANKLLKAFNKMGKKWNTGNAYTNDTNWDLFEDNTCYDNGHRYGEVSDYNKIYEFEEVDLGEYETITLKEFWESECLQAIHCNTEEKAKELLKAFDKMGKKWRNGESYIKINNWNEYHYYTCYGNNGTYGDKYFCDKIYEFEDVDFGEYAEDKTMSDLFNEMQKRIDKFFLNEIIKAVMKKAKGKPKETPKEKTWEFTEKQKAFLKMLDKKWKYIARDLESNYVCIYDERPTKENTYWNNHGKCKSISDELFEDFKFDNIKWGDEPCEFRKYLGEEDD